MAKALPLFAVDPRGSLAANAPLMLHTRLEELYGFADCVGDPERVEELHNMRIAAKRLRYTMEIFASCFTGKEFDQLYDAVKKVQEQIGDIHDADVRIPILQAFLKKHERKRPEIHVGLQSLIASQAEARNRGYNTFVSYWNKLQSQQFKRRFIQMLVPIDTDMKKEK